MRTTVDIPDELLRQAKQRSLSDGRTLGSILTDGLRILLFDGAADRSSTPVELKTYGSAGLRAGVRLESNASLRDLMDSE